MLIRFECYSMGFLRGCYSENFPTLESAVSHATQLLFPDADGFVDRVVFVEDNPNKNHVRKYTVERCWVSQL